MYKAHVSEVKKREVQDIKDLARKYRVIGIVNMMNLPALQLQRIKQNLKDIKLKFSKKRLIKIAFDQLKEEKKNILELKEKLEGMPALLFTNKDPFELAKVINKNKSKAFAKSGQIAPDDLIIPAGPTDFPAGPMIGELGALGVKTKVDAGKIVILDDKLLVKKGEQINEKQASLLSKLGIEPMQIGLDLLFTYEDGEILSKDVLFVDEELYISNIKKAGSEAIALALEIGYVVEDTVELLLAKACREARKLEEVAKVEEVKEELKAEEKPKEEPKPELVVEKKEKPKVEEKKEKVEEPKPEPIVEEKPIKEEPRIEEPKKEPVVEKETVLEKEIKEQKKVVEEQAPKDKEDKVVIESKKDGFEEMSEKAKEILDSVVTEKLKKEGSPIKIKSIELRERKKVDDVNKFINELKDKKAKEES